MNARNCQLCGKPLSRLRVGGDGDFCSKDHRNQFRLRAGMDRLVEVNKVASLMRRRESARQIPIASLMRRGLTARHDFADLIPATIDAPPRLIELRTASTARPRIAAGADSCLSRPPLPAPGVMPPARPHGEEISLLPAGASPRLRGRNHEMQVSFPRHGACDLNFPASEFPGAARDFIKLPPPPVRTHLGEGPAAMRQAARIWQGAAPQPRPVATGPAPGNALRVSIGLGFGVPPLAKPRRQPEIRAASSLLPVERMHPFTGTHRDCPVATRSLAMLMPEIAAKLPAAPAGAGPSGFDICQALNTNGRMLRDMPAPDPRTGDFRWAPVEPRLSRSQISQTAAGFARRNGAHLFPISLRPNFSDAAPRTGESPFLLHDDLCVPTVPYCNVLAAAVSSDTAPPPDENEPAPERELVAVPPATVVRFEEHFDSGWDNWVGGVADWKVDVAGVRTGSLALYLPTLDLQDYDLEFLTRIDTRSVNWVVRAAGSDAHLRCTVTAIEGGQLEFTRARVRNGVAETAIPSATRFPGKPRTTFTVRMSAAGPVFSISIDGKTIDSWVDDRLATGGIGFVGAPDDRARLYWVRVTSPAAPGKEHTLQ